MKFRESLANKGYAALKTAAVAGVAVGCVLAGNNLVDLVNERNQINILNDSEVNTLNRTSGQCIGVALEAGFNGEDNFRATGETISSKTYAWAGKTLEISNNGSLGARVKLSGPLKRGTDALKRDSIAVYRDGINKEVTVGNLVWMLKTKQSGLMSFSGEAGNFMISENSDRNSDQTSSKILLAGGQTKELAMSALVSSCSNLTGGEKA